MWSNQNTYILLVGMYNYSRKQFDNFFIKLNTRLPYDSSIPIMGIYHRKMETYIHTKPCMLVFIVHACSVAQSCLTLQSQSVWTVWTVARQAPLSLGFPRQEYWHGLPFPPPENLPHRGIKPASPALQADSLPMRHQESQ